MRNSAVLFSSLTPAQRSQAAAIFRDDLFGKDPMDYLYEVDAATGQLGRQRTRRVQEKGRRTHGQPRLMIHSIGTPNTDGSGILICDAGIRALAHMLANPIELTAAARFPAEV